MKNVALGLLGHVDVGKTSIVRRLTSLHSTAALDKHPQSQERGITIDLGFSAIVFDDVDLRVTLVDCPGHLSLLRTMIGGAHIVDMLLLVVDVTSGIQQQTLDCLVLGELSAATNKDVIVVLNKLDLVPVDKWREQIEKVKHTLRNQFRGTLFESCPMIPVAATTPAGICDGDRISTLSNCIKKMALSCKCVRDIHGPFHMSVDHCFAVSGQGTVLTGTVMRGSISVGDMVELPLLGLKRTVKSIQAFRIPQTRAKAGDRVGLCISGLTPKLMERGTVSFPGSVELVTSVIAVVRGTKFYQDKCLSGGLFNIQIGHVNIPARVEFFGARELQTTPEILKYQEQHGNDGDRKCNLLPELKMDWDRDFVAQNDLIEINNNDGEEKEDQDQPPLALRTLQLAVVNFNEPMYVPYPAIGISISPKFVKGEGIQGCNMAFYLRLLEPCTESRQPRIYTLRERKGIIIRPAGDKVVLSGGNQGWTEAVCGGMFKKETILTPFIGMIVETETGELGRITGAFGRSGKIRVKFPIGAEVFEGKCIRLCFRRYKYDKSMSMHQDHEREAIKEMECQSAKLLLPKQQEPEIPNLVVAASSNTQSSHLLNVQQTHQELLQAPQIRNGLVVSIQDVKGSQEPQKYTVCILDGFFTAEENIKLYKGKVVELESGVKGNLLGPFGKAGKCKVEFKSETLQSRQVLNSTAHLVL